MGLEDGNKAPVTLSENKNVYHFLPTKGFDPNGGVFHEADVTAATTKAVQERVMEGDQTVYRSFTESFDDIMPDFGNPNGSLNADPNSHAVRSLMLAAKLVCRDTKYF